MPSSDDESSLHTDSKHTENIRIPTRFCGIGVVLILILSLALWNTTELVGFLLGNGENMATTTVSRNGTVIDATSHSGAISVRISNRNDSLILKRPTDASNVERIKARPLLNRTKTDPNIANTTSTKIPVALMLPLATQKCCGQGKNPFEQTCFTERACANNTLYPFTSLEEKNLLQLWRPQYQPKRDHKRHCSAANQELQPPTTWCGGTTNTSHPFGCSHLIGMGAGSGPYDRMLAFATNKLLFCGIPKAGITQWLQFLRFTLGAADFQSLPYFKEDTKPFYFDRLIPKTKQFMWDTYTKAILIRDPAERLLSAYLDKIATKGGKKAPFGQNVTFSDFVDLLSSNKNFTRGPNHNMYPGLTFFSDPHWRPQAWSCGLSENIQEFDYIGTLDNAANHTKALLDSVGLWESHGKYYRVSKPGWKKGSLAMTFPPRPLSPNETAAGFQQEERGMDTFKHNKDSRSKIDKYYTPELMKKVKEVYWMDFDLWDALQIAKKQGLVHGKDIAKLLKPECGR